MTAATETPTYSAFTVSTTSSDDVNWPSEAVNLNTYVPTVVKVAFVVVLCGALNNTGAGPETIDH